jgi:UDP-glucose 4-epimerase
MRVLVTGGAGFIGSHIVDRLVRDGYRVRVIDNLSSGRLENIKHHLESNSIELIIGDLKDPQIALRAVEGVDTVFHFAANPEVRVSTTNPEIHFNENIVATFNLLEAMGRKNVKELVFASSSSVYGEPEEIPVDENAPIRPVSVYGASKAACEALIHAYTKLYGVKAVVLRYANVVGPRLRHGVVWDFINKLLKNPTELEILGDEKQVRSYIYIDDAIEATITAWRKDRDKLRGIQHSLRRLDNSRQSSRRSNQSSRIKQREENIQTSTPRSWVARRRKENSTKNRQDKEAGIQTSNELKRSSKSGNKKVIRGNQC